VWVEEAITNYAQELEERETPIDEMINMTRQLEAEEQGPILNEI